MIIIPYTTRKSSASTIYIVNRRIDFQYIMERLNQISSTPYEPIIDDIDKTLPKRGPNEGFLPNSIRSIADGVLQNFKTGQYLLSMPKVKCITAAFDKIHEYMKEWDRVRFDEVSSLPKHSNIIEENLTVSTYSTFFDNEAL